MRLTVELTLKSETIKIACEYVRISDGLQHQTIAGYITSEKYSCIADFVFVENIHKFDKIKVSINSNLFGNSSSFYSVVWEKVGKYCELKEGIISYVEDRYITTRLILENVQKTGKYTGEK
jgi:hypothetical protein